MKKQVARLIIVTLVLLGMCLPLAQPGRAMPIPPGCVWLGSADTSWGNAANWNCGHVPTSTDPVTIWNLTGAHSPVLTGSGAAQTLSLDPLAWLKFDPDAQLEVQSGVIFNSQSQLSPGNGILVLNNGNWTNNGGVFDAPELSTVIFNGYGDQQINGTAATQSFGNVAVNNMSMAMPGVLVGGDTKTVNLAGTLTINQDATFNTGTATGLNLGGDLTNNGGAFQGSAALQTTFNGSGPQVIGGTAASQTFPGSLSIDKSGGSVTFGGATTQVTVNGSLYVGSGTLNLGAGTLTVNGATSIFKTGVLDLGSSTWDPNACVTISTGGTLLPGSGTVNFHGGSWSNYGGTVGAGNWTANFYPNPSQVIGGAAANQQFHTFGVYNNTMGPAGVMVSGGTQTLSFTGDVVIGDSATFDVGPVKSLLLMHNWENNGRFVPRGSNATFDASDGLQARTATAVQTIGGAQPTIFNDLTIDNPAGVTLDNSQEVSGTLDLRSGDLTTAAHTLNLGSAATVTGAHQVIGAVQRTQAFAAGVPYSFSGADLTITFAEVGSVTGLAVDTQLVAPDKLKPALPRTITITPAGTGYLATLRLPYLDAELNGIPEADLRLWRQGPERWETQGPQVTNAAGNWVEQSGITAFSAWALAPVNASQGSRVYLPLVLR